MLDPENNKEIINEFSGFELDVFFIKKKNSFGVKHHGKDSQYTLDSYFKTFTNLEDKYFWIDHKNLDYTNLKPALIRLNKIVVKYQLKDKIIIESKNIELLNEFKVNGFHISYWLPNYHFLGSIFSSFSIRKNLLKYKPDAISCDYHSVHFYDKKFPNYSLHCWLNDMTEEKDKEKIYLKKII